MTYSHLKVLIEDLSALLEELAEKAGKLQEEGQKGNEPEILSELDLKVGRTHYISDFLNYGDSTTRSESSIRQSI
tara:strand:+ start:1481 stop:1705 length:225 start_codon:yes stop_codon:yes gene_type:complete